MNQLYIWSFIIAVAGISVFTLSFLVFSKWWKSLVSFSLALSFVSVSFIASVPVFRYLLGFSNGLEIPTSPLLIVFAVVSWVLPVVYFKIQFGKSSKV